LLVKKEEYDILKDFTGKWIERLDLVDSLDKTEELLREFVNEVPERVKKFQLSQKIVEEIKEKSFFHINSLKQSEVEERLKNPFFLKYLSRSSQRSQAKKSTAIDSDSIGDIFNDDGTAKTIAGGMIKYDKLFPKFSRLSPVIPTKTSKQIDLLLNLALPTKELTSLVEAIKDAYEKNSDVFQVDTPLELASEIDKDIFNIQIKVKKKSSKTKLEMPEKRQQEVYADLFFIYDVYTTSGITKAGAIIDLR